MCKGKCGKCKKAEFETTDVQVESLGQRSVVVGDIKIGMTDGDDSQELQPSCMRCQTRQQIIERMTADLWGVKVSSNAKELAETLYELGYRK